MGLGDVELEEDDIGVVEDVERCEEVVQAWCCCFLLYKSNKKTCLSITPSATFRNCGACRTLIVDKACRRLANYAVKRSWPIRLAGACFRDQRGSRA